MSIFYHLTLYIMKKLFALVCVCTLSVLVLAWCSNKNSIKVGDVVSITYTATFSDGKVFDQNTEKSPLMFIVWSGQVIEALDKGVVGMNIGNTKTITVNPAQWYGKLYNESNIQKISQLIFDKLSISPKDGSTQNLWGVEGIVKGTEKDGSGNVLVLFDINPRQTYETLKYKVTIIAKDRTATPPTK